MSLRRNDVEQLPDAGGVAAGDLFTLSRQGRWRKVAAIDLLNVAPLPYRSVTLHGAKIDGATDDTAAIQATLDYLSVRGGGVAFIPVGTGPAIISDTLRVYHSGVGLVCEAFDDFHITPPSWPNAVNTSTASALKWHGVAGGVMIDVCPVEVSSGVWNDNGGGIAGINIDVVTIAGEYPFTSVAAIGVRARGVSGSRFRVTGVEFSDAAMVGTAIDRAAGMQSSFAWNHISYVAARNVSTTGGILRLDGLVPFKGNAFQNTVDIVTGIYSNGTALKLGACDNTLLRQVRMQRIDGGTGTGVVFSASDDASGCTNLVTIDLLSAGAGGVVAQGTAHGAYPSHSNRINNYNPDELGAPAIPLIEAGARLFYTDGHKSGGGSFTAKKAANQVVPASTLTKVAFGTQLFNKDGWFDAATSQFQPKFPGRYLLSVRVSCVIAAADGNLSLTLQLNDGVQSFRSYVSPLVIGTSTFAVDGMFEMNGTTDYVQVDMIHANSSSVTINQGTNETFFLGSRLA